MSVLHDYMHSNAEHLDDSSFELCWKLDSGVDNRIMSRLPLPVCEELPENGRSFRRRPPLADRLLVQRWYFSR
jgi:hypothetical protein